LGIEGKLKLFGISPKLLLIVSTGISKNLTIKVDRRIAIIEPGFFLIIF
jgi:hypothetical protein